MFALQRNLGVKMLRSEALVLAMIKTDPGHAISHYMSRSGLSQRGFTNVLSVLVKHGLVSERRCPSDARRKILG